MKRERRQPTPREWQRISSVKGREHYCRSCTRTPNASASLRAVRGDAIWRNSSNSEMESAETPLLAESCWRVIRRSSRTRLRFCSSGMGHAYPFCTRPERLAALRPTREAWHKARAPVHTSGIKQVFGTEWRGE
jgi:hypothetical protein